MESEIDAVIAACCARAQEGDVAAFARACADHPAFAARIRAAESALRELGAVGGAAAAAPLPRRLDRFLLVSELGRGGMGAVYRAHDPKFKRDVALKILPRSAASAESLSRFEREWRLLARCMHPNIVRVHESGSAGGEDWFAMDLVEGESLGRILARRRDRPVAELGPEELAAAGGAAPAGARSYVDAAVALVAIVADALDHAHRAGVVHRDVKPNNILVDRRGAPFLTDFGVAVATGDSRLTRTGGRPGTPAYMAPEQIEAGRAPPGPATDVFALGVTLYELLTGRRPFDGETFEQVHRATLAGDPVPPRRIDRAIPRDLETICLCAMRRDVARRYASAEAFAADLRCWRESRPIAARAAGPLERLGKFARRRPWLAGAAGLALAASVAAGARTLDRERRAQRCRTAIAAAFAALDREPQDLELARREAEVARAQDVASADVATLDREIAQQDERDRRSRVEQDASQRLASYRAGAAAAGAVRYEEALAGLQELCAVSPDNPSLTALFRDLFAKRAQELERARGAAAPAGSGSAGDGAAILVDGSPPGAEAFLFRFEKTAAASGPERLVAMPTSPGHAIADAATWAGHPAFVVERVDGAALADAAPIARGDLIVAVADAPIGETPVVVELADDGDARRAGVQLFDRVVRIDAVSIAGIQDVEQFVAHHAPDARFEVAFRRDAREVVATLAVRELAREVDATGDLFDHDLRDAVPVDVVSAGVARKTTLHVGRGSGIHAVATADPLVLLPECRLGRLPLPPFRVPPGSYLLLVRADGHEDLRLPFVASAADVRLDAALLPDGASPPGMVWIPAGSFVVGGDARARDPRPAQSLWCDGFWIGRTEVTVGEYLEFLDDPETLAAVERSERQRDLILVPRDASSQGPPRTLWRPVWSRGDDGRWRGPDRLQLPITRISCADADAYCAWRNRRARARHEPWFFRLPIEDEWEKSARGVDGRCFPWGDRFDPRLCLAKTTRPTPDAAPELVARLLTDESPFGVRDTAGNLLEWCIGYHPIQTTRAYRGGVVGNDESDDAASYRSASRFEGRPDNAAFHDGFRIVAWRREP